MQKKKKKHLTIILPLEISTTVYIFVYLISYMYTEIGGIGFLNILYMELYGILYNLIFYGG